MFNKLFQLIRNEYGTTLGRIQYSGNDMKRGSASTAEHEEFQFEIYEGSDMEVIIKKDENPARRIRITIPNSSHSLHEKEVRNNTLIPSVLAALIFSKEAKLIA